MYRKAGTRRIEPISVTHKRNSKGIRLYKDGGKDAKDRLRKDEAMSLGDVDGLPEMD
jgi:hypothetical protein